MENKDYDVKNYKKISKPCHPIDIYVLEDGTLWQDYSPLGLSDETIKTLCSSDKGLFILDLLVNYIAKDNNGK